MAGAVAQPSQAPAEDKAAAAKSQAEAAQQAVDAQVLDSYRAQSALQGAPVQSYYRPQGSMAAQSPYLRVPGFQGVANPFYSPTQPAQQANAGQARAADLLSQYNAYKQNNANAMYQAKVAQLAQAQAMQKAYQDKIAADKAKADAEKAKQDSLSRFGMFGNVSDSSWTGSSYAQGGIAELMKGKK